MAPKSNSDDLIAALVYNHDTSEHFKGKHLKTILFDAPVML
jgi:hypothetical protein